MKQCTNEKCNKEIEDSKKFCSRSCAASHNNKKRKHSEETKNKIKDSLSKRKKTIRAKAASDAWVALSNNALMNEDFNNLSFSRMRKRVILEQNNKCGRCTLSKWLGEELVLELDHKDGNNRNNTRNNLIALCPNCHSLTPTWRGKNKSNFGVKKVTDDQIVEEYIKCNNIHQTLINLNMAPKGNNYGRVKRALTIRNIEFESNINKNSKKRENKKYKKMVELRCPSCFNSFSIPKNVSHLIPCKSNTIKCCSRKCSYDYSKIRKNLEDFEIKSIQKEMFIREYTKYH